MNSKTLSCCMALLTLLLASNVAAAPGATPFNPKPADGDVILPMPDGAEMAFRRIEVPGEGFWGSEERIIQLGDASGGIFEGLQRTQINASFPPQSDLSRGFIVLAKYELTKGQFIAVMGMDHLLAVSANPDDQQLPTLQGRAQRDALMTPLAFVSAQEIEHFIRRYNNWLFDPQHPERRVNLPQVDEVPGYLRLPTEEEWEYSARGGISALEAGRFEDRLPFEQRALNENAWHLGNARHQLRPIGLRQANELGLHDMLGNAQEITSGRFRPEIWQGQPGGMAVRGGSVSTPAADLRSSLRAELDVYAWNADQGRMEERRSFNTGVRLALGSNVVVSTAQRARIEQEYEAYRQDARRATPVGRSLDNLVAQASVSLDTVDPILNRLIAQDPALAEPLAAVQAHMNTARERLDLAQRASARSLLQDAARNGVNLSVYISRLTQLKATFATAQELAEMSTRYQQQVSQIEQRINELQTSLQEQLQGYRTKVSELGDYDSRYVTYAFDALEETDRTAREDLVVELIREHIAEYAEQRRADLDLWLQTFESRFASFEG